MRRVAGILIGLGLLLAGCYVESGDWVWVPEEGSITPINYNIEVTSGGTDEWYSCCAHNPDRGEYMVVYEAGGQIMGVILEDYRGSVVVSPFPISISASCQYPRVAYNPYSGEYVVVWEDWGAGDADIWGARVDADGNVLLLFEVTAQVGLDEREPRLAVDTYSGHFLIVWDEESVGSGTDIACQLYEDDADPASSVVLLCVNSADQQSADVTYNSDDREYLVVWMDARNGDYDIYGRIVNSAAVPVTSEIPICDDPADQFFPTTAYSTYQDLYLVVWEDYRYGDAGIYARRVDYYGALFGYDFPIFDDANNQRNPAIAYNSACDGFIVVWEDDYNGNWDIWGVALDSYGSPYGDAVLLSDYAVSNLRPAVAPNCRDSEYLITWHCNYAGDWDIYAQLAQ